VEKAMALAVVLSERKVHTKTDPLKILLDIGVHEIEAGNYGKTLNVNRSQITFVGKGKDQTTILGGFKVNNQQNVTFEELTITNPRLRRFGEKEFGLDLQGTETTVAVLKCAVKNCGEAGLISDGASVTATQCEFMTNNGTGVYCSGSDGKAKLIDCKIHHNKSDGLCADGGEVDLHGTKTDIHSNKGRGMWANRGGKIHIHLPPQHNTSHGHVAGDCFLKNGGSIAYFAMEL